jgi:hypothetical protein
LKETSEGVREVWSYGQARAIQLWSADYLATGSKEVRRLLANIRQIPARELLSHMRTLGIPRRRAYRVFDKAGARLRRLAGHQHAYISELRSSPPLDARELLNNILAHGPVVAAEGRRQVREAGVSNRALRLAMRALGVKAHRHGSGQCKRGEPWYWCLPGQETPPNPPRKRRGRPKGETEEVARRKKEMLEAWDRGEFQTKKEAGEKYGFDKSDATRYINEHLAKPGGE